MAEKKTFKKLGFLGLLVAGIVVFLLGIVVLGLGLALTHNDTFNDNKMLKSYVRPQIDYVQYWVGLPFIITGISITCSAFYLRNTKLTVCTLVLSMISVVLALAGLVVDGPDFSFWKNLRAYQRYWEAESGYACSSIGDTCQCIPTSTTTTLVTKSIASFASCGTIDDLATIYGILIGAMIIALVILLAAIFLIVYVITTSREKSHRSRRYSTRVMTVSNHDNQGYYHATGPVSSNPVYDSGPIANRGAYEAESIHSRGYSQSYPQTNNTRPNSGPAIREIKGSGDDTLRIREEDGIVIDNARFRFEEDDVY